MIEAIYKAHEINQTIIAFINQIVAEAGKPKHAYESCAIPEEMFEQIKTIVTPEEMETAVFTDEKQVREENIRNITAKLEEAFAEKEDYLAVLGEAVYQYQKKTVRKMIFIFASGISFAPASIIITFSAVEATVIFRSPLSHCS